MKDRDLRFELPARAYINAQLMSLLERGGTLWDAKNRLFSSEPYINQKLDPYMYAPYDYSLAVSLLYCTVVVPREFLNLPQSHPIFAAFDKESALSDFSIQRPQIVDSYLFLRLLRNSVAHALYSIRHDNDHLEYHFWTDKDPCLKASTTQEGLIHFLSTVGQRLTNAVLTERDKEGV